MLNWAILKNPLNWAIVWVVLLIGAFFFHLLHETMTNSSLATE